MKVVSGEVPSARPCRQHARGANPIPPMPDISFTIHHGDCLTVLRTLPAHSADSLVTDPPAGISFMGHDWDANRGGRAQWVEWMIGVLAECHRVLKPGAHALIWAMPRTSHWTAAAAEDAGFEVRDVITHHFGTGFPKSMDVSKAIDKLAGAKRKVIGTKITGNAKLSHSRTGEFADGKHGGEQTVDVTAPATEQAKQWNGWGTALKPASEHWILCRKPIDQSNSAANVITHGTGAINIDASRIGTEQTITMRNGNSGSHGRYGIDARIFRRLNPPGRWPSNLILSHGDGCTDGQCEPGCPVAAINHQQPDVSRFFYCPKPSRADRGADNNHPTVKATALMSYLIGLVTPPGGVVLDPFAGSGTTGVAAIAGGWSFVGIEQDADYHAVAMRRVTAAGEAGTSRPHRQAA